jgi:hypothetical protein
MSGFEEQVQRRMSDYNTLTLKDVYEFIRDVYHFTIPEGKEPGESAFNVLDYYNMEELAVVVMRAQTEADTLREHLNAAADEADTRRKELETMLDRLIQAEKANNITVCAYCGHESPKGNMMEIVEHTMACEKRPEKTLLEKAFEVEDRLYLRLLHLTKHAYNPENCDFCKEVAKTLSFYLEEK